MRIPSAKNYEPPTGRTGFSPKQERPKDASFGPESYKEKVAHMGSAPLGLSAPQGAPQFEAFVPKESFGDRSPKERAPKEPSDPKMIVPKTIEA